MKIQENINQLQQKTTYYDTLLQVSNHGILITDASRNIIEVNDVFCSFIGQNRKAVIESNLFKWLDMFSGDASEDWIKLEKAVQSKQIVSNYEFQLSLNNEIRYFDVNASLLGKIENEKQSRIISSWHDITDRKKAEEAQEKSKEKFQLITENTSDVITLNTFDLKATFAYVSPSCKALSGYEPEELLGKSVFEFIHPEDKKALIPLLKKYIGYKLKKVITGKEHTYTETIEFRIKQKTGNWLYVQSTGNIVGNQLLFVTRDIAERKKMEKELIRLSNAFRMSIDSVVISDLEGKITDVNEATLKMYGTDDKTNLIGKNSFDIFAPEDKVKAVASMRELRGKGYSKDKKFNVILKDGSKISVEMSTSIMKGMEGEPIGFIGITRDITDRTQTENLLVQSEKKYRDLFEKSEDAVSIIHNGKFVDCNQATVNMLRYNNKEEFLNTHPSELSPEKQPDGRMSFTKANEIFKIAFENGSYRFEWNHKKSDGEVFPVEVLLTAISTDEKNQIFHTVWRDITERKQAEEALQEREKQLKTLIDTMPDFVCFKDGNGHWLMANEACIRIFRLENINYRGKKDSKLAKLNSHLRDSFLTCEESDARVWKEGRLCHGEETIPDPEGSIRVYDVTKVPVSHPDGERKGLVILGHDITERKQAEEELEKHREHLEELVKERTAELEEKNAKLEYFNKLFVGREFRIKELRDRVKELEEKISDI